MQSVSISESPEKARQESIRILRTGGILLFPTETVYGLGVDASHPTAIDRLFTLKGRPSDKPFQWLVHDVSVVRKHSPVWTPELDALTGKYWPGPLTLVLPDQKGGTIGWRVPRHAWLQGMLAEWGGPVAASSANPSGQPPPTRFEDAVKYFEGSVAFGIDGGPTETGVASTVVKWDGGKFQVLREGAISHKDVEVSVSLGR